LKGVLRRFDTWFRKPTVFGSCLLVYAAVFTYEFQSFEKLSNQCQVDLRWSDDFQNRMLLTRIENRLAYIDVRISNSRLSQAEQEQSMVDLKKAWKKYVEESDRLTRDVQDEKNRRQLECKSMEKDSYYRYLTSIIITLAAAIYCFWSGFRPPVAEKSNA
jgi:hypothetical protein